MSIKVFKEVGMVHIYDMDWYAYDFRDMPMTSWKVAHVCRVTT